MGYCTWWLTIALCFSALATSQGNEIPEPQVMPFDDSKTKEPPMITVFDVEEVEGDDGKDMTEDDEGEMELLSRDFMDTNPKEVKGQPDTPKRTKRASSTCSFDLRNGVYYWSSPGFGVQNYPNNAKCGIMGRSLVGTAMLTMTLHSFELQSGINGMCPKDKLEITLVHNQTITYCGIRSGEVIRSPSFNFYSWFTTNSRITKPGFGIIIKATRTPCHKAITAAAGVTGMIYSPKGQNYCEYRIVAPTTKQVKIDYVIPLFTTSPPCVNDFILLNGNSEKMYPVATSKIICGSEPVQNPKTSTTGEMYVAYKRSTGEGIGFVLMYTIV